MYPMYTLICSLLTDFDYEWYSKMMQTLTLNCININIPGTESPKDSTKSINTSIASFGGVGLYYLTCFYNHSCTPNASVHYIDDNAISIQQLFSLLIAQIFTLLRTSQKEKNYTFRTSLIQMRHGRRDNCICLNTMVSGAIVPSVRMRK